MKTKLEQLTVAQFTDLLCGDTSVLMESRKERPLENEIAKAVRGILFEYRSIADAPGMRTYLMRMEEYAKARITMQITGICREMLSLGRHNMVRDVLEDMDVNARRMSDSRVEAEIESQEGRAGTLIAEIEDEFKTETDAARSRDIRREFDEQTAALMAHFKFQIETDSMKATLYAHLIARYTGEMKAMAKAARGK